jgi:hypothetical protein
MSSHQNPNFIVPFPPPFPAVSPGDGGSVTSPHGNDVLSGRGSQVNNHEGNIQFRAIVSEWKPAYNADNVANLEKTHICAEIVARIRAMDPPGRFLQFNERKRVWLEIGDMKARKKAGQALRQKKSEELRCGTTPSKPHRHGTEKSPACVTASSEGLAKSVDSNNDSSVSTPS